MRKVLIFNPRYDQDLPDIVKSLEGLTLGCKECSKEKKYCPKAIENFINEVAENMDIEAILVSEPYWKKNYDTSAIALVNKIANNNEIEFWVVENYSEDFAIAEVDKEKHQIKIEKNLKDIFKFETFWWEKI